MSVARVIDPQAGLRSTGPFFEDLVKDKSGFEALAATLKKLTGISLGHNTKNYSLMASRLGKIMNGQGILTYGQYQSFLNTAAQHHTQAFISALTTNTTQFFREDRHFEVLVERLPAILTNLRASASDLRIWCAACSKGQEIYSLLMSVLEKDSGLQSHGVKLLATDIDREILGAASRGIYSKEEMTDVPNHLRQKYFNELSGNGLHAHQVKKKIRELVTFARFNLVYDTMSFRNPFDVVFCRNVLIYFEKSTSEKVVERLASQLKPGGLLFVGHCETGYVKSSMLRSVGHAVYERVGGESRELRKRS
jgi:chemotaxis protein methyltransferase CheR